MPTHLEFLESCQHITTADLTQKWTNNTGGAIVSAQNRWGGPALDIGPNEVAVTLPLSIEKTVGFNYRQPTLPGSARGIASFRYLGSTQAYLILHPNGKLEVWNTHQAAVALTTSFHIHSNINYYIEWYVECANAGATQVRVNRVTHINASGDFKSHDGVAGLDGLALSFGYFSDIYVINDDDYLGDVKIDKILPNAVGDYTAFTVNGDSQWQALDDPTPNGNTDYVESSTVDQKFTNHFEDVTLTGDCLGIQVLANASKEGSNSSLFKHLIRISGADYEGNEESVGNSYTYYRQCFDLNPLTDLAFTEGDLDAIQYGAKLTADE